MLLFILFLLLILLSLLLLSLLLLFNFVWRGLVLLPSLVSLGPLQLANNQPLETFLTQNRQQNCVHHKMYFSEETKVPYFDMFHSDICFHRFADVILREPNDLTGKHSESAKACHDPERFADMAFTFHQSPKSVRGGVSTKLIQLLDRSTFLLVFLEHAVKLDDWRAFRFIS